MTQQRMRKGISYIHSHYQEIYMQSCFTMGRFTLYGLDLRLSYQVELNNEVEGRLENQWKTLNSTTGLSKPSRLATLS